MNLENITELLSSTLRLSVPLMFAAFGGLLSERSGVANIALESYLLVSAFTAGAVTATTHSLIVGVLAGLAGALLVGVIFAIICIWGRGDQIVIGTGINFLSVGLLPILTRSWFGVTGSTPSLPLDERISLVWPFLVIAAMIALVLHFAFQRTRFGLRLWAAGENPLALRVQGVSVSWTRFNAIVVGSVIAGAGGIFLSLCQGSGYIRNMSAGRGFIALAALIFGRWLPLQTLAACLFFGLTDAIQIQVQGKSFFDIQVPNQFVQILPYAMTLFVLIFWSKKIKSPRAINQDLSNLTSN